MSRLDMLEAERTINTVVLCSMVGLLMALLLATVMVYEESSLDDSQTVRGPKDCGQPHAETTAERPRK